MEEKMLCAVCGAEFAFEEEEKEMYARMGFNKGPMRCKACRGTQKALESAVKPPKETYTALCDACGKETQLPFKPKGDKPVYCKACFLKQKTEKTERK